MRNYKEVMDTLIGFAEKDRRILAVYMNGSRVNINAVKDDCQDYDVVYVVRETESFIENKNWISFLGEISYMQLPDTFDSETKETYESYGYLMQFVDGVRIDLTLKTEERAQKDIKEDSLTRIIFDKEKILPETEPDDSDYWVKSPSEKEFLNTCNEFWWCTNNIAKGLRRMEIPYFQDIMNFITRKELEKMLSWKVGILTDFKVSIGKSGKYMGRWIKEDYEKYLMTYTGSDIEEAWKATFIMCRLFHETALFVSDKLGYIYNLKEAENAYRFLTQQSLQEGESRD